MREAYIRAVYLHKNAHRRMLVFDDCRRASKFSMACTSLTVQRAGTRCVIWLHSNGKVRISRQAQRADYKVVDRSSRDSAGRAINWKSPPIRSGGIRE